MLVPHPERPRARHLALHALEHVHHDPIRPVADGVDARLEPRLRRGQRPGVDLGFGGGQEARRARFVAVGGQHRGPARPERAVGADLDRAHREVVVAIVRDRAGLEERLELRQRPAEHHVEARLEGPTVNQPLVGLDLVAAHPGIVHHRQAQLASLGVGQEDLLLELSRGRIGNAGPHQPHGAVDHHARRVAGGIADVAAALGVGRRLPHLGDPERQGVGDGGVAIDPREEHRVVGRHRVERVPGWPGGVGPVVLVPRAPEDPLARRGLAHAFLHHPDDLREAGRAAQVEPLEALAEPGEVTMGVVEARDDRPAAGIDDTGRGAPPPERAGVVAHEGDAGAVDRDRRGPRVPGVDGVHEGVVHDQIGRWRRLGAEGRQRGGTDGRERGGSKGVAAAHAEVLGVGERGKV